MNQKRLTKAIKELYAANLGVKKEERVLVFTDTLLPDEDVIEADRERRSALALLAGKVAETGKDICGHITFITYPSLKFHGSEPPREVWIGAFGEKTVHELEEDDLLEKVIRKEWLSQEELRDVKKIVESNRDGAVHAVIALSHFSTSHTKFRELLTTVCNARYASMPLFDEEMFYGPMQVDWKALKQRTGNLSVFMDGAEKVFITAPNGTNLVIGIKGRKMLSDDGDLTRPGSFGNLPAGEVFVAPVEGTTEGIMALEWAPTSKLESPVTLTIEKGLVKDVKGRDPYAKKLDAKLNENPLFRNIAELGIGTNDMAKRADNILESEKILGTIHIALGDNSTFGGKVRTSFHQDFVIFKPTVKALKGDKGMVILKDGVLIIE